MPKDGAGIVIPQTQQSPLTPEERFGGEQETPQIYSGTPVADIKRQFKEAIEAMDVSAEKELTSNPSVHAGMLGNPDPFTQQVGGNYYKHFSPQPYEWFYNNNIPHHKAAIIRRILRYDQPGGKGLQDLNKISHEVDLIKKLAGY